jgi:hypothetical protein
MDINNNRAIRLIYILLEHPVGLRFEEFWRIVHSQKICSKGTFAKLLKELEKDNLIYKDKLNHYTLGVTEPIAQKIMESSYVIPKKVQDFLDALYMSYEWDAQKEASLYVEVGIRYLLNEQRKLLSWTWLLFPLLFDKKVRELWFIGHKCALEANFEKLDEISEKFLHFKVSQILSTKEVIEQYMVPHLNLLISQIESENKKILELINELQIGNDLKERLRQKIKGS